MVDHRWLAMVPSFGRWSWPMRVVGLVGWFLLFLVPVTLLAWMVRGEASARSAVLAALVCMFSGVASLAVTALVAPPSRPAAHVLVGMAIRMGGPLLVCLYVQQFGDSLIEAGFAWYLIGAFLWGLVFETLLSVGQLTQPQVNQHGS